jgi:hypothetical protein
MARSFSWICVKLYDQSGNGNDMVSPSTSAQPLYVASGLNSKPILRFNTSQSIKIILIFLPLLGCIQQNKQVLVEVEF